MENRFSGIFKKVDKNTLSMLLLYIISITALILAAYSTDRVQRRTPRLDTNHIADMVISSLGDQEYHIVDNFYNMKAVSSAPVPNGAGTQTHDVIAKHDGTLSSISAYLSGPSLTDGSLSYLNIATALAYMKSPYVTGLEMVLAGLFATGQKSYDAFYKASYDYYVGNKETYCQNWFAIKSWVSTNKESGTWGVDSLWSDEWMDTYGHSDWQTAWGQVKLASPASDTTSELTVNEAEVTVTTAFTSDQTGWLSEALSHYNDLCDCSSYDDFYGVGYLDLTGVPVEVRNGNYTYFISYRR